MIEKDKKYQASAFDISSGENEHLPDAAGIIIYPDGVSIARRRLENADRYNTEKKVFFSSGCAHLFRKEMLEDIGLFDEDFIAHTDETDMGRSGQSAGWKCFCQPKAIIYHIH